MIRALSALNENQRTYHSHLTVRDDWFHGAIINIVCADRWLRIRIRYDEIFPVRPKIAHCLQVGEIAVL
jgi:hypothetical protein